MVKYNYVGAGTKDNPHANAMWIHYGFETDFGWVCPHCDQHVKHTAVWFDKDTNMQVCFEAFKLKENKTLRDVITDND